MIQDHFASILKQGARGVEAEPAALGSPDKFRERRRQPQKIAKCTRMEDILQGHSPIHEFPKRMAAE
jgi:hypothetical protein